MPAKTITIKRSKYALSDPFTLAEFICSLDPKDPHRELKIANLLKGYTHGVQASENYSATWRTDHFTTVEEYQQFFRDRAEKHQPVNSNWFQPSTDGWKLKHFYQGAKPSECTSRGKKCVCWRIK